jgi:V8-like Glu-specific endopeptidase
MILQFAERNRLQQLLAVLYDFSTARGRRVLIEMAELGRFLPGLVLDEQPRQVAGQLIVTLEKYGRLPAPSTYHALGALLGYLLQMSDIPQDDRRFFAELMVKYSLSADPNQIESVREEFGIHEAPVRPPEPDAATLPAASRFKAGPDPAFDVSIQDEPGLERVINSEDNFLDLYLLSGALDCAKAVCMVEIPRGNPVGTGFLVGPDLLLTNQHVLPRKELLPDAALRFDHSLDPNGAATMGRVFHLQPDFYVASDETLLDYALVRVKRQPLEDLAKKGLHRGYLAVSGRFLVEKERVNIIQHPGGMPLKVVLTQNYVARDMSGTRVQYLADTMRGSSGSPVFDRNWRVVALHHSGKPYPPETTVETAKNLLRGRRTANEGIPMRAILNEITKYLPAT